MGFSFDLLPLNLLSPLDRDIIPVLARVDLLPLRELMHSLTFVHSLYSTYNHGFGLDDILLI
jgi:hypothetical protein